MFKRRPKPSRIDTLIGKSTHISGDLEFAGGLHLDGRVDGGVRGTPSEGSSLSVSESGSIGGGVTAHNVMLNGSVKGDIVAGGRVALGSTARVQGDVYYGVIEMALGAQIMGKLTRIAAEVEGPRTASAAAEGFARTSKDL